MKGRLIDDDEEIYKEREICDWAKNIIRKFPEEFNIKWD